MDVFHLLSIVEPAYFRIAEVVGVMKHPVVEIVEGVEAGGSPGSRQAEARRPREVAAGIGKLCRRDR